MKSNRSRLVLLFAIVGVCAVLYGAWRFHQEQVAQHQMRNFSGPPASSASGAPDAFHNAPPPPQP